MASPNPVPSRAALNALRGVILTTSCSVILLAEERRRRLKIARAAIDNARKLHTVRSNRGPIALTDSRGSWESRFSDVGDEVLSMSSLPRPRTSTRRRRRSAQTNPTPPNTETHTHNHSSAQLAQATEGRTSAAGSVNPLELHSLVPEMIHLEALKLLPSNALPKRRNLGWKPPTAFTTPDAPSSAQSTRRSAPPNEANDTPIKLDWLEAQPHDMGTKSVNNHSTVESPDAVETARQYLARLTQNGSPPRPFYDEALVALERLLEDLESHWVDQAGVSQRIELATSILQRLGSFGLPLPKAAKPLRCQGIKLLRIALDSDQVKATTVLAALLSLCKDPLKAIVPFIQFTQADGFNKHMGPALKLFSDPTRSRLWMRGMLVYRMLARYGRSQENFQDTKQLYRAMQVAGLFQKFDIPIATKYKIRRLMVLMAVDKGDDAFAQQEMRAIQTLEPNASNFDMKLQSKLVVRDATLGQWESVHAHIEVLKHVADVGCIEFQGMLTKVTDAFSQSHSPEELETHLRSFVAEYRIKLKYRWVYLVLDGYASRHQADSVFLWLRFCSDSGLCLDDAFVQRFYSRCRKYWSFSDKSISNLQRGLQASSSSNSGTGADNADPVGVSQLSSQWPKARKDYPAASSARTSGTNMSIFSAHSLRLAVAEQLRSNATQVEGAIALVESAYERGHDISEALTPLLLARLGRGDDPNDLIDEALRMGARIHDSVYNKAAQALSAMGNLRAAAEMCEVAARENANGELLCNEYNFANLVFAYTGSARYTALQSVLSRFTSEEQWWRGSRTCKESIKLAMKTAAMRTVVHTTEKVSHRQALDKLDEALMHVKKCRSNRDHRRAVTEAFVRVIKTPKAETRGAVVQRGARGGKALVNRPSPEQKTESPQPVAHPMFAAAAGGG
ncbi:hypothetical protein TOPH_06629 [Tolypocladium ophioglossoides CBS 100239]|uniref:Uncharacterized protein n=1 Tax=Tolypocladium ophioglossoides (strain CBS 100239) TaxID=1163406 RepID=A0A0L0N3W7_TOLOC|nr:hypothetical protein TOPH_06629 [Tolypocladium ophioglossoides CBS 100239]